MLQHTDEIARLIQSHEEGLALPREFYTSAEIYDRDIET